MALRPGARHDARVQVTEITRRVGRDFLYLITGFPIAVAAFTIATTGFSTALGLLIVLVGVPIAALTIVILRGIAMVERRRAALVLDEPIPDAYKQPKSDSVRDRAVALFTDSATWLDVAYALVFFPVATIGGSLALAGWAAALGLVTSPLWYWSIPYHQGITHVGPFPTDTFARSLLAMLLGLVAVPLVAVLCRGAAAGTAALASVLLGPSRQRLEERVETLQTTRAEAVDVAATELQRIERDLHDGAQARLVAMALDLGMAEDRFDRDPEAARELLTKARGDAREALAELRDLARGIRPALLSERGLGDALEALAARTPLPTTTAVVLDERPPPAVEAAIYFTVTEALTNAVKHSGARRARVHVWRDRGRVIAEVRDDGRGGANAQGNGLDGLRRRLAVLDGTLGVDSPAGGPTTVRAEVPCAS